MTDAPHVPSRLAMAHAAPRCGASRKHDGCPCQQPAMANGRCRFHWGKSTGARTAEGAERARRAVLRHGFYTEVARRERLDARSALVGLQEVLAVLR
jgi:hypothetical protein